MTKAGAGGLCAHQALEPGVRRDRPRGRDETGLFGSTSQMLLSASDSCRVWTGESLMLLVESRELLWSVLSLQGAGIADLQLVIYLFYYALIRHGEHCFAFQFLTRFWLHICSHSTLVIVNCKFSFPRNLSVKDKMIIPDSAHPRGSPSLRDEQVSLVSACQVHSA